MPSDLRPLGWDEEWAAAFASYAAVGLLPARVGRVDRGRLEVHLRPSETVHAVAHLEAGATVEDQPAVGDWVAVDPRPDGAVVTGVLPRRTLIVRSSAGRRSEGQAMAANVDTVLIAVPLEREARLAQLERFLTVGWESGARPVVVLTKSDVVDHDEIDVALLRAREAAPGVQVLAVSAETGSGTDAVRAALGTTTAVVGQSGAGKSTLVNALAGAEVMATQATRQDGKGRHTTTARELIALPGEGVLIDTPGLRGIGVHDANNGVAQSFSDIEALAEECRFRDCTHETEPGCAVTAAIDDGALTRRRLDSYRKQLREVEWAGRRNAADARAAHAKRWAEQTAHGKGHGRGVH
ncbi:ribosome small subunit-dependent GTPase A [Luteipulveratus sp. YIM 133132]|uniref:ribosome small subunit-dependent GTPase A n=1 Tax=Luteipulveratus flavus TaxID=3031728 RepID=UPI0023AE8F84|nr:ribosome small subunit-dependent GTPase A [Luteipulveratus sp. YIM 133132]MDE9366590.1 ribosome small subunit-dependent GTPase A [Luteipulveratus sp. YIM 133132]